MRKFILRRQRSCRCPTGTAAPEELSQRRGRLQEQWGWMDGWMDGWVGGWVDGWMQHLTHAKKKEGNRITARTGKFTFICPQVKSLNVVLTEPVPQKQTGSFLLWTPEPWALRALGWTGFASESCDCLGLVGLELWGSLGRATGASAAPAAVCSPILTLSYCCVCLQRHWKTFLK